jgi:hypothetical protein
LAGLAVCSATVWRAPDNVSATHRVGASTQALVADPGVMEAQAASVEIAVEAPEPVVIAVGRDTDVQAWVADSPVEHLTGFRSRESFTVRESGSDEPLADAARSDLWILARQVSGEGKIRWDKADEGRWSLVVAPVDSDGPGLDGVELTMTWPQEVRTPLLWPGVVLGVLIAAAASIWWLAWLRRAAGPGAPPDASGQVASAHKVADAADLALAAKAVGALGSAASPPAAPLVAMTPAAPELGATTTVGAGSLGSAAAGAVPDAPGPLSPEPAALELPASGPAAVEPSALVPGAPEPALAEPAAEPVGVGQVAAEAGLEAAPPPPARVKRRWFARWSRSATAEGGEAAPAELAAVDEPAAEPPKIDLGMATPNRTWERLAASDPRYSELDLDAELDSVSLAMASNTVPSEPGTDQAAGRGDNELPVAPEPARGIVQGQPTKPTGSPWAVSPSQNAAPRPMVPAPSLAELDVLAAGQGAGYRPVTAPSRGGLPQRPGPAAPPVTPAQKIAALRQSHTSDADEAASTIAAAMAAAAGAGSAAGLTRRQIREAERAASEALHVAGRGTGEIPPWNSRAEGRRPQVQMQSSEVEES